jgi:hypothetical protein
MSLQRANSDAPTTIPAGTDYAAAEAIARRMSDRDLLTVAKGLSATRCGAAELAANHEVNRRFGRLRDRFTAVDRSMDSLNVKHDALQARFDKLVLVLQRVLTLLAGPEGFPREPPSSQAC